MKKLTEAKIKHILNPLKVAEFKTQWCECPQCQGTQIFFYGNLLEECVYCDGTGFVPQIEPDDGSEVGL